jgi:PhzF family phenazine biosynthesis protein
MMMRAYKVVDAFSAKPFLGNPVAVILDADGLDDAAMRAIARWTNLSETTFLLPATHPDADYLLRIFTPRGELPFAGHPTLGSAHAVIEAGRFVPNDGVLVQQCGVGLVRIEVSGTGEERIITLALPPARMATLAAGDSAELEAVLGAPFKSGCLPATVDVGPVWIVAEMADAAAVLDLAPDFGRSAALERRLGVTGVTVFGRYAEGGTAIEVRSFAPSGGVEEDPVCGSGNGSVAVFQTSRGLIPSTATGYVAGQGQRVGRDGKVLISVGDDGQISVGGACVTCVDGTLLSG